MPQSNISTQKISLVSKPRERQIADASYCQSKPMNIYEAAVIAHDAPVFYFMEKLSREVIADGVEDLYKKLNKVSLSPLFRRLGLALNANVLMYEDNEEGVLQEIHSHKSPSSKKTIRLVRHNDEQYSFLFNPTELNVVFTSPEMAQEVSSVALHEETSSSVAADGLISTDTSFSNSSSIFDSSIAQLSFDDASPSLSLNDSRASDSPDFVAANGLPLITGSESDQDNKVSQSLGNPFALSDETSTPEAKKEEVLVVSGNPFDDVEELPSEAMSVPFSSLLSNPEASKAEEEDNSAKAQAAPLEPYESYFMASHDLLKANESDSAKVANDKAGLDKIIKQIEVRVKADLINNPKKFTEEDALKIAEQVSTMTGLALGGMSKHGGEFISRQDFNDAVKTFNAKTKPYQMKRSWRALLGAFLGAVVGFVAGAAVTFYTGPGCLIGGLIGAGVGFSLGAAGFGLYARKKDSLHQFSEQSKRLNNTLRKAS